MSCFQLPDSFLDEIQSIIARFWWGARGDECKIHWKSWDKLCLPKSKGGMGFRDLKIFNQALLAKQGWRLINGGESLLFRVLKAKYFKNSDFLSSHRGYDPSFTWRSIWGAKAILLEGLKWKVGDGLCINAWTEAWIQSESPYCVPVPKPTSNPNLMVAQLIDKENNTWDDAVLLREFNEEDIMRIKMLPLRERLSKDILYWRLSTDGVYTTKSGYWLGKLGYPTYDCGPQNMVDDKYWETVWNLEGPPKLKHFLWRLSSEALVVKVNLAKRHITPNAICPICRSQNETTIHALFECDLVSQVWWYSSFFGYLLEAPMESIVDRLLWCQERMNKDDFLRFVTIMWACWKIRNNLVHHNPVVHHPSLVDGFSKLVADFKVHAAKLNFQRIDSKVRSNTDWVPPNFGEVKINTDVHVVGDNTLKLGMVARNWQGKIHVAAVRRTTIHASVEMGEALAMRWGLQMARRLGFSKIVLESDSLRVVQLLMSPRTFLSPLGLLLEDISVLEKSFVSFTFNHVKRVGNIVAYSVARLNPGDGVEELFVDVIPQGITITLAGLDSPFIN